MSKTRKNSFPPPLALLESKLGPAREWAGRCYEIATACVNLGLVEGVAVYGHWLGPIAPGSMFATKTKVGFCQHGWIFVRGNRNMILDPTRWAFEDVDPYVYFGPNKGEYDEGGNELKKAMRRPVPKFDPSDKLCSFNQRVIASEAWSHVERLLGGDSYTMAVMDNDLDLGSVTNEQVFWLANAPYDDLEPFTWEIYQAIARSGNQAAVPIDNWNRAEREHRAKSRKKAVG